MSMMVWSSNGMWVGGRDRSAGNDKKVGRMFHARSSGRSNEQTVWIEERGRSEAQVDIVPRHLVLNDFDFTRDDVVGPEGQVRHGDVPT